MPGTLRPARDGVGSVVLSEAARVALSGAGALGEGSVTLGIRPQDLRLGGVDEPDAVVATVFAFEPLQEVGRLTVTLPGVAQRLVIETHHDYWANGGDLVGLRFDPARTHLFDGTTGARLAWEPLAAPAAAPIAAAAASAATAISSRPSSPGTASS